MSKLNFNWSQFGQLQKKEKFLNSKSVQDKMTKNFMDFAKSDVGAGIKVSYTGSNDHEVKISLQQFVENFLSDQGDIIWKDHLEKSKRAKQRAKMAQQSNEKIVPQTHLSLTSKGSNVSGGTK